MVADSWGATGNGAACKQLDWNGHTNQQWKITHRGGGQYNIVNRTTGKLLDSGGNVSEGSATRQWDWGNSTNLQWTISPV